MTVCWTIFLPLLFGLIFLYILLIISLDSLPGVVYSLMPSLCLSIRESRPYIPHPRHHQPFGGRAQLYNQGSSNGTTTNSNNNNNKNNWFIRWVIGFENCIKYLLKSALSNIVGGGVVVAISLGGGGGGRVPIVPNWLQ